MSDEIITKDGFSYGFKPSACEECEGHCCTGESGYIWVSKEEIKNIAEFLNVDEKVFIDDYLNKIQYKFSIKEIKVKGEYECIFFDNKTKKCQIYEVRPKQCKTFPFWDYFKNRVNEVKKECIGIV